ncbi:uncharacterized protein LOC118276592 [Spodoptera frugiperda]|uniref:Uncharacterized protein LOC118276592 n=1 Tax=Spodoptera frugiperda TaxID=7108 RepID=A0A9R0F008_SPOFR|nr:uncharacterized protein LOC118276592 [Spodoptera frugiperda]
MFIRLSKMLPLIWRIRRPMLVVLLVMCISPIIFFSIDQAKDVIKDERDTGKLREKGKVKETMFGFKKGLKLTFKKGCKIPQVDPFSPGMIVQSVQLYIVLLIFQKSECRLVKDVLKDVRDVTCDYSNINYVNHRNYYYSYLKSVNGEEPVTLDQSDHVKVECTGRDLRFPNVSVHWRGVKTGFRNITLGPDDKHPYNVLIICLESVSHAGFIRNMKKSYKYITEQMKATILNGYNIVGDGTTGSLYPLLAGKTESDLKDPNDIGILPDNPNDLIFNQLKVHGFRTAYFDDMGLVTTPYQFKFPSPPADHYLRPYSLARRNGKPQRSLSHHCIESAPQYQMILNLVKDCLELDGKKVIFSLIDDLSYENFTFVPSADDSLLDFLKMMTAKKMLEDTMLIVMGDHGPRYTPTRSSHQGMLEERLPFMSLMLPHKLVKARPSALKALVGNKDVLTTPFDIYVTILDVLGVEEDYPPIVVEGYDYPRGWNLLTPVSKKRSCGEAGIMPHWCTCGTWTNVSKTDPFYHQVPHNLAEFINSMSDEERSQCIPRYLKTTEWVVHQTAEDYQSKLYNYFQKKQLVVNQAYRGDVTSLDDYYQMRIVMDPGHAIYEGTMIYIPGKDFFMITERDVSRVNAYGDESSCISETHPHLIKYCYCNNSAHSNNQIHKKIKKPKYSDDLFRFSFL